jgi:hypothetical protein
MPEMLGLFGLMASFMLMFIPFNWYIRAIHTRRLLVSVIVALPLVGITLWLSVLGLSHYSSECPTEYGWQASTACLIFNPILLGMAALAAAGVGAYLGGPIAKYFAFWACKGLSYNPYQ